MKKILDFKSLPAHQLIFMKIILPPKLKFGDSIGIVSPSDPIEKGIHVEQFERGMKIIESMGFKLVIGKNLNSTDPKEKAEDINEMFSNPKIKAIICSQGGDSAEQTLAYIDWKAVKNNPKIFMGLSDITVFLNAIFAKTGLLTFHGDDVRFGFGKNPTEYDKREFIDLLVNGRVEEVRPNGYRKTIRSGKASGRLLGGNVRCLLKLAETEFLPDFKNSILLMEAYKATKEDCLKYFSKLKELGVFEKVSGVIVGFIYGMQVENPTGPQMENILLEFTKDYDFPILKINDFGHNCPNTVLPIGCKAEFDADEKKIKILERCVK